MDVFRREWGAITFVVTILIGAVAVAISLGVSAVHGAPTTTPLPCPTYTPYVSSPTPVPTATPWLSAACGRTWSPAAGCPPTNRFRLIAGFTGGRAV